MRYDRPRFLDQGETALTVEFGDAVDPALNARVLAVDAAFQAAAPPGVRETTPTYRSLLVHYEPLEISRETLVAWIEARIGDAGDEAERPGAAGGALDCFASLAMTEPPSPASSQPLRHCEERSDEAIQSRLPHRANWLVPCCYDPALAEDIAEAAAILDLAPPELAARHAASDYRAYMYGFAPGWCYLGGLPERLAIPRRLAPRGPTPEGAVLIGGGLSLVATNPMPTGWYVIGRTPERLFSLRREPPFLIAPGDALRFEPIDAATFGALDARAAAGETVILRAPG